MDRFNPTTEKHINEVEKQLGVALLHEYKQFLLITNGFSQTSITEPEFFSINKIDWLKNVEKELIEIWKNDGIKDVGEQLERAIIIGDSNGEQQFLLISPRKNEVWKLWKFASWIPGAEEYDTLETYFNELLEFLIEIKNQPK